MVNARAKNIVNGHCPHVPVAKMSLPGPARAKKFCPLPITNHYMSRVMDSQWLNSSIWVCDVVFCEFLAALLGPGREVLAKVKAITEAFKVKNDFENGLSGPKYVLLHTHIVKIL